MTRRDRLILRLRGWWSFRRLCAQAQRKANEDRKEEQAR